MSQLSFIPSMVAHNQMAFHIEHTLILSEWWTLQVHSRIHLHIDIHIHCVLTCDALCFLNALMSIYLVSFKCGVLQESQTIREGNKKIHLSGLLGLFHFFFQFKCNTRFNKHLHTNKLSVCVLHITSQTDSVQIIIHTFFKNKKADQLVAEKHSWCDKEANIHVSIIISRTDFFPELIMSQICLTNTSHWATNC